MRAMRGHKIKVFKGEQHRPALHRPPRHKRAVKKIQYRGGGGGPAAITHISNKEHKEGT